MSKNLKITFVLLLICVLIIIGPLMFIKNSEFSGADGAAKDAIAEIDPTYETWASPIITPPGGETESLLFCLQAALGAGVLGYGFGVLRERNRKEKGKKDHDSN